MTEDKNVSNTLDLSHNLFHQ